MDQRRLWRVDETYVKVRAAGPSCIGGGQPRPDDRFPALGQTGRAGGETVLPQGIGAAQTVNPRTITVDKNQAYPKAVTDEAKLRTLAFLAAGQPQSQQHRGAGPPPGETVIRPGPGSGGFWTARRTSPARRPTATTRKGTIKHQPNHIRAEAPLIAGLFQVAA